MEDQQMTPIARWIKLDKDGTQTSGNGWQQHSTGTWNIDEASDKLTIENTNGIYDPFGSFDVSVKDESMKWTRMEDGQNVMVSLHRIDELPRAPADRLIGLWKLKSIQKNGSDITNSMDPDNNAYLLIRWDNLYQIRNETLEETGTYRVHGHRNAMELNPYGEASNRKVWSFQWVNDELIFKQELSDDTPDQVTRTYSRTNQFPE